MEHETNPNWFNRYFLSPARVSLVRRILSIVLGVVLFIALVLFGTMMALQLTAFNPDYIASYVDDANVADAATTWLNENVAPQRPIVARAAELAVNYYEPQIKEQLSSLVRNIYAFFLNRMEQGRLLQTVAEQRTRVNDIANNIQSIFQVPALQSLFNNLGIDPSVFGSRVDPEQINSFFDLIDRAGRYQSLLAFANGFYVPLILIILALIIIILFVGRKLRFVFLVLGVVFTLFGILELSSLLPVGNYIRSAITGLNLSSLANDSAMRFTGDIVRLMNIFSAVILFLGLCLIAAYFFVRPRHAVEESAI